VKRTRSFVTIGPASEEYLEAELGVARAAGKPAGRDRWVMPEPVSNQVVALHGDVIVEAQTNTDQVPVEALLHAITELHPVTVEQLMAIWRKAHRRSR